MVRSFNGDHAIGSMAFFLFKEGKNVLGGYMQIALIVIGFIALVNILVIWLRWRATRDIVSPTKSYFFALQQQRDFL